MLFIQLRPYKASIIRGRHKLRVPKEYTFLRHAQSWVSQFSVGDSGRPVLLDQGFGGGGFMMKDGAISER